MHKCDFCEAEATESLPLYGPTQMSLEDNAPNPLLGYMRIPVCEDCSARIGGHFPIHRHITGLGRKITVNRDQEVAA